MKFFSNLGYGALTSAVLAASAVKAIDLDVNDPSELLYFVASIFHIR